MLWVPGTLGLIPEVPGLGSGHAQARVGVVQSGCLCAPVPVRGESGAQDQEPGGLSFRFAPMAQLWRRGRLMADARGMLCSQMRGHALPHRASLALTFLCSQHAPTQTPSGAHPCTPAPPNPHPRPCTGARPHTHARAHGGCRPPGGLRLGLIKAKETSPNRLQLQKHSQNSEPALSPGAASRLHSPGHSPSRIPPLPHCPPRPLPRPRDSCAGTPATDPPAGRGALAIRTLFS